MTEILTTGQRETAFYTMEAQLKHFANKTIHVDTAV
jgi:hypothetical protein